jgi:hypothetical protein
MNLDNDYDNDGNNIVPCPICLNVFCPSKEGGKCPEEDEYAKAMNTPAQEWRSELRALAKNNNLIDVEQGKVDALYLKDAEEIIQNFLNQHSAHLVERIDEERREGRILELELLQMHLNRQIVESTVSTDSIYGYIDARVKALQAIDIVKDNK